MSDEKRFIPVVDISPLYSDNPADWKAVDQAIGQACLESGAFLADGIPRPVKPDSEQTKKLLAFYDLDTEHRIEVGMKKVNPNNERHYRGYTANLKNGWAHNEMYDIGPDYEVTGPNIPDIDQLIETNAWPSQAPATGWQAEMERYYTHMHNFGRLLIRSIVRFLGADETVAAARFEHSNSTLRLLNYPPLPEGIVIGDEPDAVREFGGEKLRLMAMEHKDQCCLSLLWQSDAGGLQMQSPAGDWLAVPAVKDGISVHIGMAMESMTDNAFVATPHRVLGKGNSRQSIGFFVEPNLFGSVKPFAKEAGPENTAAEDSYAALLLNTIAERSARRKAKEAAEAAEA